MLDNVAKQKEDIEYIKAQTRAKFPALGATMAFLPVVADDRIKTAATDGHQIVYSPKFFSTLSDEQKVFVFAHEVMHVAFNHILRSKGRNQKLWNIATDSVINQLLKMENLPLVEGGVNISEAINHSSEEMYDKLLAKKAQRQKEKQEQQGQQSQSDSSSASDGTDLDDSDIDWDDENEQVGHDDHDIWKKAVEQADREEKEKQGKQEHQKDKESGEQYDPSQNREVPELKDEDIDAYEKGFFAKNQEKRRKIAEQIRNDLNKQKIEATKNDGYTSADSVGNTKTPVADWKKILKRSINEEQERWSYRRASAENDFSARLEALEDEGFPDTEIMLDVSGSVDINLIHEFLRQLKPILKSSKMKVGCFDTKFFDFKEIKSEKDIDKLRPPDGSGGGTDLDLPVRCFSNKKETNKIIFTDGYAHDNDMPKNDLRNKNVIWIVYGNESFAPCCGKVIQVSERQICSYINKLPPSRDGR